MNLHIIAVTAAIISFPVCAETLIWTGGSASSDNFSDAANWSPSQSPANGDTLVFKGETRTSPYNDCDPETFAFKSLIFTNDNSSGCSAPFTIKGNALKITSSILCAKAVQDSITDTFEADVIFAGSGTFYIGGKSVGNHHFTFNGNFSGPSDKQLQNETQYASQIRFNGDIEGFSYFHRPNGNGKIYFYGHNNAFTGKEGYDFGQGEMYFIDADNFGPAPIFRSGQGGYNTPGKVHFTPTNDITIAANIGLASPSQSNDGLTIYNNTQGTTVTFTGNLFVYETKNNQGSRLRTAGGGNVVLKGNIINENIAILKEGTGTWTLSEEIESSMMTGLVTVAAGKLEIDCELSEKQKVEVRTGATLAGSGKLGEQTTFYTDSNLEIGDEAVLSTDGSIVLSGSITVNYTGTKSFEKGSTTAIFSFGGISGTGGFLAGAGFPNGATLSVNGNTLYVSVPSSIITWTGAANSEWDTSAANWSGTETVYSDGMGVVFPDLSDASKRTVNVDSVLQPLNISILSSADRPYTFAGDGTVSGAGFISFGGTATNTWAVDTTDVPSMSVTAGLLVLDAEIRNSAIIVSSDASLTQTVASAIGGTSTLALYGPRHDLCARNTFTGGLEVGQKGAATTTLHARAPNALGEGDININYNTTVYTYSDIAVTNRTLHFWSALNISRIYIYSGSFDWSGDIVIHGNPSAEILVQNNTTPVIIGKDDLSSSVSYTGDRNIVFVGNLHMYANVNCSQKFAFRNNMYLYSTNNSWDSLGINTGTPYMMADGVLPARPLTMLQQWNKTIYTATLNLNGFNQTITSLDITDYDRSIQNRAYIKSDLPATLTISNDTASSFSDINTFYVTGAATLRKAGSGTWTLGCNNTSSGNLEITGGIVTVEAAESMPDGPKSVLRIADDAVLNLPEGIAAEISYAERIIAGKTRMVRAGLYGGQDCTVAGVVKTDWISGAGTLAVKHDNGGTIMFVR